MILSLIIVSSSFVSVLAQSYPNSDQINNGRYSQADPNGSGVGEGSPADDFNYKKYNALKNKDMNQSGEISSMLNGCNCVIFRLDDIQDYWLSDVQATVMDQFIQKNQKLSIGPIMNYFGEDSIVVNKAVAGYNSGLFEVFVHGWDHVDYTQLSLSTQTSTLQQSQSKMQSIFGSISTVFVPPYNAFNANTLTALKNTGFKIISAAEYTDSYPYFVADGSGNIVDSQGLYHLPESIGFVEYDNDNAIRIPTSQILAAIDSSISSKGYAVVTIHSQEFAQVVNGSQIDAVDQNLLNDLNSVINGVLAKNYSIRTFNQVVAFNQPASASITISDVTSPEGNSGTSNFVFTVTRSNNVGAVSVNYATADNTASSASDYVAKPITTLNFAAGGPLTQTVTISVNGDTAVESNESFFVNLSSCVGCTITDSQGTGNITNDDSTTPNIIINDITLTEGNSGTKNFVFTITRSSNAAAASVQYATASNTAVSPADYIAIPLTTMNFLAGGSLTQTITVSVNGDSTVEPNEKFFVNLSNCVGCNITDSQGVGTITNDDSAPKIAIIDVSLSEGNSGTKNFVFTVTRTGDTTGISSVNFATSNVSAKSTDYTAKSGTVSFVAGETTKSISISVIGDTVREKNETFNVNLSNPIGCTISDSLGIGTILNDD